MTMYNLKKFSCTEEFSAGDFGGSISVLTKV